MTLILVIFSKNILDSNVEYILTFIEKMSLILVTFSKNITEIVISNTSIEYIKIFIAKCR